MSKAVPGGWTVAELGDVFHVTGGDSAPQDEKVFSREGIPFIRMKTLGVVHQTNNLSDSNEFIHPDIAEKFNMRLFQPGTIILPRSGSVYMNHRAILGCPAYIVGHLAALVAKDSNVDIQYAYYYLCKLNLAPYSTKTTSLDSISFTELKKIPLVFPPIPEQQKIAAILSSVDDAIEKTKSVIEQTKVVKKGLMQELLTRGIPGRHKKFKKTRIGKIPEEWEVVRFKNIAHLITSGSRGWAQYYSDIGPLFLRIGNLTRDHINLRLDNLIHVNMPKNAEGTRALATEGDILISITADLGVIGIIPQGFGEAYVNQHIALVKVNFTHFNPRWIAHFLSSKVGQRELQKMNDSGSKAGLNLNAIANLKIAMPGKNEQKHIAALIDHIDEYIEDETDIVSSFQNLKAALMQVLLSGEVRVQT